MNRPSNAPLPFRGIAAAVIATAILAIAVPLSVGIAAWRHLRLAALPGACRAAIRSEFQEFRDFLGGVTAEVRRQRRIERLIAGAQKRSDHRG